MSEMSYAFTMPAEELSYSDFTRRAAVRPSHLVLASNGKFNSALFQRLYIIKHISLEQMNSLLFGIHEFLQVMYEENNFSRLETVPTKTIKSGTVSRCLSNAYSSQSSLAEWEPLYPIWLPHFIKKR